MAGPSKYLDETISLAWLRTSKWEKLVGDGHWEDSDYDGKTRCESHKKISTLNTNTEWTSRVGDEGCST